MTRRAPKPHEIMDYPRLDDALWIIWNWNDVPWPSGNRRTGFLGNRRHDPMKGYALWEPSWDLGLTFQSREDAEAYLREQETKRGMAWTGVRITTVATYKARLQYPKT